MTDKSESKSFVTTIDLKLSDKMIEDLKAQSFEIAKPQYTIFQAKKKGVTCTLYASGKLMVQGKEMQSFIEFYLEPEILKNFSFTYQTIGESSEGNQTGLDTTARIGIDESGKGDFFGPLCVAGVYASGDDFYKLKALGVKDSKDLSDPMILKIAKKIRADFQHHIVKINPSKYNELYAQFKNLNSLLAWGHATTIEHLVAKTQCHKVIVDQFAGEWVVKTALKRKKIEIDLHQRHRAEEDLVVAAASILARETFLEGMKKLSEEFQILLPKGASAKTIQAGRDFVRKYGLESLPKVAKMHFKTLDSIVNKT